VQAICSFIRLTGLSDTAAGAMAGVKRSTLARWKQEDEEVEMELEQARFQFQAPRLARIDETRMKDGQLDWRAQAWLVKFANPQVHGRPSSRRRLQDVELAQERPLTPEEQAAKDEAEKQAFLTRALEGWEKFEQDGANGVITPEMLALLQQRRAIALRQVPAEEESAAAEAEAPAPGARPGDAPAGRADGAAPVPPNSAKVQASYAFPGPKNVAIRPEIHWPHGHQPRIPRPGEADGAPANSPRTAVAMAG
jgi:hypothetical protein